MFHRNPVCYSSEHVTLDGNIFLETRFEQKYDTHFFGKENPMKGEKTD